MVGVAKADKTRGWTMLGPGPSRTRTGMDWLVLLGIRRSPKGFLRIIVDVFSGGEHMQLAASPVQRESL